LVGLRRKHKIVCDVFIVIGMFGIVMLIFVWMFWYCYFLIFTIRFWNWLQYLWDPLFVFFSFVFCLCNFL
jgi:signal transduction histidine kinase